MSIWKYIKADSFFKDYAPKIKSHKFKIRGFNSRGNPTRFSKEEIKIINTFLKKMIREQNVQECDATGLNQGTKS